MHNNITSSEPRTEPRADSRAADKTIHRTPTPGCPACEARRLHTEDDWLFHPGRGQGASSHA